MVFIRIFNVPTALSGPTNALSASSPTSLSSVLKLSGPLALALLHSRPLSIYSHLLPYREFNSSVLGHCRRLVCSASVGGPVCSATTTTRPTGLTSTLGYGTFAGFGNRATMMAVSARPTCSLPTSNSMLVYSATKAFSAIAIDPTNTSASTLAPFGATSRLSPSNAGTIPFSASNTTTLLTPLDTATVLNRLSAIEDGDAVALVHALYDLVSHGLFTLDDRVQNALGLLRSLKHSIGDHQTLLKAVEVLHSVGDHESLLQMLSFYAADVPFMPTAVLVNLLGICSKLTAVSEYLSSPSASDTLVQLKMLLLDQLWLNISSFYNLGTCGTTTTAANTPANSTATTGDGASASAFSTPIHLEALLYCYERINEPRILYHSLTAIDFSAINAFDELLSALRLYCLFVRDGNEPIHGFAAAGLDRFEALLSSSTFNTTMATTGTVNSNTGTVNTNTNNSTNTSTNSTNPICTTNTYFTHHFGLTPSSAKHIVSCYRALTRIKRYEPLTISSALFGSTIGQIAPVLADMRQLVLLLRDLYYSQLDSAHGMAGELVSITNALVGALFDNIAQLSKEELVLMVRMLAKLSTRGATITTTGYGPSATIATTVTTTGYCASTSLSSSISPITTSFTHQNSGLVLSPTHLELLNTQLLLHLSDCSPKELLAIVKYYYLLPSTSEVISLMGSIFDRLSAGIASVGVANKDGSVSMLGGAITGASSGATPTIGSSTGATTTIRASLNDCADTNDPNISVYAMSRLLLYFNYIVANSLNRSAVLRSMPTSPLVASSVPSGRLGYLNQQQSNGRGQHQYDKDGVISHYCPTHLAKSMPSRLKRYVRAISRTHINLSSSTVAYCLYTLYRLGHDPVRLVQQLLPSLHSRLHGSLDLVQSLLFFSRYRRRPGYDSTHAMLLARVADKLAASAFNVRQLVILCLVRHKRVFASQLFSAIAARLGELSPAQLCTVYGAYVRAGLSGQAMLDELNRFIRSNISSISAKDALNLLLPIKKGHLADPQVVDHVRSLPLDASDLFDVFGLIPMVSASPPNAPDCPGTDALPAATIMSCYALTDHQVIRCLLFLRDKQWSPENDSFAKYLYDRLVKIAHTLSGSELRAVLTSIQAYGYSKPKVVRILSNLLGSAARPHNGPPPSGTTGHTSPACLAVSPGTNKRSGRSPAPIDSPSTPSGASITMFRHISEGPPHLSRASSQQ